MHDLTRNRAVAVSYRIDRLSGSVTSAHRLCPLIAVLLACRSPDDKALPGDRVAPAPVAIERATRVLPVPDYQRKIGTAHPLRVIARADTGRWIVACQARADTDGKDGIKVTIGTDSLEGDAMAPYVFRGGGDGEAIDAYIASSPDERWLAVLRDEQLIVIDDVKGTETLVRDADVRRDDTGVEHLAAFDGASKRLIYFRRVQDARRVVIRDLTRGSERDLEFPHVLVLQVDPAPDGSWARVRFLRDEIDPDPRADGPEARRVAARQQTCDSSVRYEAGELGSSEVHVAWLQLDSGALAEDASVLEHLGDLDVTKAADKAIRLGSAVVVPATCDATLLAVSATPPRLLVRCKTTTGNAPVEMFGQGVHVVLGPGRLMSDERQPVRRLDTSYVCTDAARCFALQDGTPIPVRGYVQATRPTKLLTQERGTYFVVDSVTGRAQPLPGVTGRGWGPRARNIMALGTAIVDLDEGRVLGEVAEPPIGVDITGRALFSVGRTGRDQLASGPLWWAEPSPRRQQP